MTHRELPRGQVWFLFIVEHGASWYMPEAESGHSRTWAADQISEHGGRVAEVWEFIRGIRGLNSDGSVQGAAVNCTAGVAGILFDRLQAQRIDDWSPAEVEFCIRHGYEDSIDEIRADTGRDRSDWARQEASFRGAR
jgi:hypothetical protein